MGLGGHVASFIDLFSKLAISQRLRFYLRIRRSRLKYPQLTGVGYTLLGKYGLSQMKTSKKIEALDAAQTDRIIQMAWEDRTTFDAIREQFGLEPGEVIKLMRSSLKPGSFRLWRKRTVGRTTKHQQKRSFEVGRFRCPSQRG